MGNSNVKREYLSFVHINDFYCGNIPSQYDIYSFYSIAGLGLPVSCYKWISGYRDGEDWTRVSGVDIRNTRADHEMHIYSRPKYNCGNISFLHLVVIVHFNDIVWKSWNNDVIEFNVRQELRRHFIYFFTRHRIFYRCTRLHIARRFIWFRWAECLYRHFGSLPGSQLTIVCETLLLTDAITDI